MHFQRSLAFLASCITSVWAQYPNLTISFSPASSEGCDAADTALTLTTSYIGTPNRTCFDLVDLFGDISTDPLPPSFMISNEQSYDGSANYSRVLYRQVNTTVGTGQNAVRAVNLYPGRGCSQIAAEPTFGDATYPWFGFSCQSSADGDCYNLPYSVQSISITDGNVQNQRGRCWTFAELGDAVRPSVGIFKIVASVFVGLIITW